MTTTDTFTHDCPHCGAVVFVHAGVEQPHRCQPLHVTIQTAMKAQWDEGYESGYGDALAEAKNAAQVDIWVVSGPDGHLGAFATEELAREHAANSRSDEIEVERDFIRHAPIDVLDVDDEPGARS